MPPNPRVELSKIRDLPITTSTSPVSRKRMMEDFALDPNLCGCYPDNASEAYAWKNQLISYGAKELIIKY